jgi:hypothetical protein
MRVKQTDSLFSVVLLAVGLSILCISYSTWTTVNDLRQLVDSSQASHALNKRAGHHWQDIATRTIEHIEHTTATHQANLRPAPMHRVPAGIDTCLLHSQMSFKFKLHVPDAASDKGFSVFCAVHGSSQKGFMDRP